MTATSAIRDASELDAFLIAEGVAPHTAYQHDPIGWAVDKLKVRPETLRWSLNPGYESHTWDGTPDPLAAMFQAVAEWQDAGVESATTTGKSYAGAILVLWFLACWENAQVYTFAPVEKQLKLFIWKHIGEFWPAFKRHFPAADLTDLTLRMRGGLDETWSAHGYAVGIRADEQVATRAAGMHAEHMLLVYEEAQGQPPQVMLAGENTATAPHNLRVAIGNPNHQLDSLHRFCTSSGVVHIRVSAFDHPNVVTGNPNLIPGAVSGASIQKRLARYGATSPVYQSRVLGLSPEQASDSLIRLEWLKASAERFRLRKLAGKIPQTLSGKGVDVANSEHGDRAAIADFYGNCVPLIRAFQCPDANALGRHVSIEIDATGWTGRPFDAQRDVTVVGLNPFNVGVDTIGVGAGTFNELARLRKSVRAMVAGGTPLLRTECAADGSTYEWAADGNVFRHARDQWYWQLREDLRLGRIDVEADEELWEELTCPTFVDEPKTIIEPKEEIRERLGRSPDKADALVYGNWVRKRSPVTWNDAALENGPGHDPDVKLRTVDGQAPRWIGPEHDRERDDHGYGEQLPAGI